MASGYIIYWLGCQVIRDATSLWAYRKTEDSNKCYYIKSYTHLSAMEVASSYLIYITSNRLIMFEVKWSGKLRSSGRPCSSAFKAEFSLLWDLTFQDSKESSQSSDFLFKMSFNSIIRIHLAQSDRLREIKTSTKNTSRHTQVYTLDFVNLQRSLRPLLHRSKN